MSHDNSDPLAGIRVLDLTRLLPGPMCTMHLADLGADVIKVEDTGAGDYAPRTMRALVNRNKRAVRLDLKHPAGRDALLALVRRADVLVEGFRPGVMDRLGLGYETLAALRPALVYCSLSGYGRSGPWAQRAGHDLNYAAVAGVVDQNAVTDVDGVPVPALPGVPPADLLGGAAMATTGILAALVAARSTGRGRHVEVAMSDGVLAHAVMPLVALNRGEPVPPAGDGTLTGGLACYAVYRTADDRFMAVAALEMKFWQQLCATLDRPHWLPLHRQPDRAVQARLRAELAAVFATRPQAHWIELFDAVDACVSPVLRAEEALRLAHFVERGMVVDAGPDAPRALGCPIRMSDFTFRVRRPAPAPGEHTDEVLHEAGLDWSTIAALRAQGLTG